MCSSCQGLNGTLGLAQDGLKKEIAWENLKEPNVQNTIQVVFYKSFPKFQILDFKVPKKLTFMFVFQFSNKNVTVGFVSTLNYFKMSSNPSCVGYFIIKKFFFSLYILTRFYGFHNSLLIPCHKQFITLLLI